MPVVTGYLNTSGDSYIPFLSQVYGLIKRLLPESDVKFGGFAYGPVIWKISGYAMNGVYLRSDSSTAPYIFHPGMCNFDDLSNRIEGPSVVDMKYATSFMAFYDDTRELVIIKGDNPEVVCFALELLDPVNLQPVCYMVSGASSAVFATQNDVTSGSIKIVLPEPARRKDTVKVSRVYFLTPYGLLTTRRLYSAHNSNVKFSSSVQIGTKKFIQIGSYLVDVTDEV